MGDGAKNADLWETFENKANTIGLNKKTDSSSYEVRFDYIYDDKHKCNCFVGLDIAEN